MDYYVHRSFLQIFLCRKCPLIWWVPVDVIYVFVHEKLLRFLRPNTVVQPLIHYSCKPVANGNRFLGWIFNWLIACRSNCKINNSIIRYLTLAFGGKNNHFIQYCLTRQWMKWFSFSFSRLNHIKLICSINVVYEQKKKKNTISWSRDMYELFAAKIAWRSSKTLF